MNTQPQDLPQFYVELGKQYQDIARSGQPPIARLGLFATRSLQLFESSRERFQEDPPGMFAVITDDRAAWLSTSTRLFSEAIGDAIEEGSFRHIDSRMAGILFINAIFALMMRRIHTAVTTAAEDDVRELIDLYLNGLLKESKPAPVGPIR